MGRTVGGKRAAKNSDMPVDLEGSADYFTRAVSHGKGFFRLCFVEPVWSIPLHRQNNLSVFDRFPERENHVCADGSYLGPGKVNSIRPFPKPEIINDDSMLVSVPTEPGPYGPVVPLLGSKPERGIIDPAPFCEPGRRVSQGNHRSHGVGSKVIVSVFQKIFIGSIFIKTYCYWFSPTYCFYIKSRY